MQVLNRLFKYFLDSFQAEMNFFSLLIYLILLICGPFYVLTYLFIRISINDFINFDIYLSDILLSFITLFFNYPLNLNYLNLTIVILLLVFATFKKIGIGDVILLLVISFYFNYIYFELVLFLSTLLALSYCLIKKTKVIPFGPFIYLAMLIFLYLK